MFRLVIALFQFFLVSCSSIENHKLKEIYDIYTNQNKKQTERKLTRQIINNFDYPLILVQSNGILIEGLMLPQTTRGAYSNYISGSGQGITFNGFLVSKTFGMNINLISVETNESNGLIIPTKPKVWPEFTNRKYTFVTPLYQQQSEKFKCKNYIDSESVIEIFEIKYSVSKIIENCKSENSLFKNEYWVEEDGKIRKSNQFIPIKNILFEIENLEE